MSIHASTARAEHVVFNPMEFRSHSIGIKTDQPFTKCNQILNQSDRHEVFPIYLRKDSFGFFWGGGGGGSLFSLDSNYEKNDDTRSIN